MLQKGRRSRRKGGPGITRSDLLVINKIDLAPHVGADLGVMERDARRMRHPRPFVFTNLKTGEGVDAILAWLRHELLLIRLSAPARVGRDGLPALLRAPERRDRPGRLPLDAPAPGAGAAEPRPSRRRGFRAEPDGRSARWRRSAWTSRWDPARTPA